MSLRIEVPATLANLGSGYDALGLAVSLSNVFHVSEGDGGPVPDLVALTANQAAGRFGGEVPPLRVVQEERVPRSRGMGSSATARVAGLLAYQWMCDNELHPDEQLAFLAEAEGHPDNAWPALLGGLVLCGGIAKRVEIHPGWSIAACSPSVEVSTPAARAALPAQVPHADAVANVRAVTLLLAGLLDGDVEAVRAGVADRLHQAWRAPLIGPVEASFAAARQLGAAPFISGSGSTLAAFVPEGGDAQSVARAMAGPFEALGQTVEARALHARTMGAVVADLP
ncbi:MAG: homoserine kinase [Alphaproteobacteria bacterium]|nr:homoserine kinase [Alphaproteobacteria bacterium]